MRNAIKKILKEVDEWDWVKDISPINHEYLLGKALHFQPNISTQDELSRIIDYLTSIGFTGYGPLDGSNFDWENEKIEGLHLTNPNAIIVWTPNLDDDGESYQEHINSYAGRKIEVLDGWETLSPTITNGLNENNELDWIKMVPSGIELETETIYYAEPPLTKDETKHFLSLINTNNKHYKEVSELIRDEVSHSLSYIIINNNDGQSYVSWDDHYTLQECIDFNPKRKNYNVIYLRDVFLKDF